MIGIPVVASGGGDQYALLGILPALLMLAALPLALLASARLPAFLGRSRETSTGLSLRSFLVGVSAGLAVILLLAASNAAPKVFGLPALLALVAAGILGLLGLAADARRLGCELRGRDPAGPGAEGGSVAVGWLVLAGLPLLPLAGVLVLLYLALRATGAAVLALFAK